MRKPRPYFSRTLIVAWLGWWALPVPRASGAADLPAAPEITAIRAQIDSTNFTGAEQHARSALRRVEASSGKNSSETAAVLDLLVEAATRAAHSGVADVREFAERAVHLHEKLSGPTHPDVATSLNNLAIVYEDTGRFSGARGCYERALAIRRTAFGVASPEVAETLKDLGILLTKLGDYDAAETSLKQSLTIRERNFDKDPMNVSRTLMGLAILYWWTSDFPSARDAYDRALAIREKALGTDNLSVAGVLNNLGALLMETGSYVEARQCFDRALAIRTRKLEPTNPLIANVLDNLADLDRKQGRFGDAQAKYEQALKILRSQPGTSPLDLAAYLLGAAELQMNLQDLPAARRGYEEVLHLRTDLLGAEHPDVASCQIELAELDLAEGHVEAAQTKSAAAERIYEHAFGREHPRTMDCEAVLARATAQSGAIGPALAEALHAEAVGREQLRRMARHAPERQATDYGAIRTSGLDCAVSIATQHPDPATARQVVDAIVQSRLLVFDEVAAERRAVAASKDSLVIRLDRELDRARTRYASLAVRGPGGASNADYQHSLDATLAAKDAVEAQLAAQSAAYHTEQQRQRIDFEAVAAHLHAGEALVVYVRYTRIPTASAAGGLNAKPVQAYAAFVVSGDKHTVAAYDLGSAGAIDTGIAAWSRDLQAGANQTDAVLAAGETACRADGERVRRALWDPLATALRAARRVFVVPDGAIHLVNFMALPLDGQRYLVEGETVVHLLTAERDLVPQRTQQRNVGLLAVGNPDFGPPEMAQAAHSRRVASGLRFRPLPASGREALDIKVLWARAVSADTLCLLGQKATERGFKAAAAGRRVIHLSTHGFLADPARDVPFAGLAFAGANRRAAAGAVEGDDGILTVDEVSSLDLEGVEWVVLSACDTGLGELRAREGVMGLRRVFQQAGARTVIASLWSVADEDAGAWMHSLYENHFQKKMDTAAAVRAASLGALQAARARGAGGHPYHWAGFVAVGDWR